MKIRFADLAFEVDDEGRLFLTQCYFIDNAKNTRNYQMTPVFDLAGGSTSGRPKLSASLATDSLRYVSHETGENALVIVQKNDEVQITSRYTAYPDTSAVRVTQTVKNITSEPLRLNALASVNLCFGNDIGDGRDYYLHRFTNHRYTESLPDVRSLYDLGLAWRNGVFRFMNIGNASSLEYVPEGILEDKKTGNLLMFQIESYAGWCSEVAASNANNFTLYLSGPTARYHDWCHVLAPDESYTSVPVALCAGKSLNDVLAEITRYRRHLRPTCEADASLPVIYNEYMHFSWDDPFEDRAIANAASVAAAGAKYYVIDCGWHNARSADTTMQMYKLFGTWYEDRGRFPHGIKYVSDYMHSLGMKFGLWVAPEVVGNENHEMLAYYGDECFIQRGGKKVAHDTGYLLDFRHPKVVDYLTRTIDRMVNEYGCDYIKFDGCPNPGLGTDYRAVCLGSGLEEAYDAFVAWSLAMTRRHPNVLFEDCAGGGQRTDYKALSIFHLLSTSDQTSYLHYPYITANIFASVLPEQAGIWSYPVDWERFDPNAPQKTNALVSKECVAINMVNAILGRIHLASRLFLLDEEKQALVREGIDFYNSITEDKLRAVPYLPLGYARFGDTTVSVGLRTEDKLYLAVWNLGGARELRIPLAGLAPKAARIAYPAAMPIPYELTEDALVLHFTEQEQARILEISL